MPAELEKLVMPELDELVALAQKVYEVKGLDLSAKQFLEALVYLRKVYLQDAVVMQQSKPEFPAFQHKVFKTSAWRAYSTAEPELVQQRETEYFTKKQDPDTALMLKALDKKAKRDKKDFMQKLNEIHDKITAVPTNPQPIASTSTSTGTASGVGVKDDAPRIADVTGLRHMYRLWVDEWRSYFSTHAKPNWKGTFGKDRQHVERWRKVEPACLYVELTEQQCEDLTGSDIIDKLQEICVTMKLAEKDLITHIRYMCQNQKGKSEVPPSLAAAFEAEGLPVPSMEAKEMRILLWENRGQKARRKAAAPM